MQVIKYDKVSISEKFSRTEKRLQDIEKYAYAYSSGYDEKLPDLLSTNEENNEEIHTATEQELNVKLTLA